MAEWREPTVGRTVALRAVRVTRVRLWRSRGWGGGLGSRSHGPPHDTSLPHPDHRSLAVGQQGAGASSAIQGRSGPRIWGRSDSQRARPGRGFRAEGRFGPPTARAVTTPFAFRGQAPPSCAPIHLIFNSKRSKIELKMLMIAEIYNAVIYYNTRSLISHSCNIWKIV